MSCKGPKTFYNRIPTDNYICVTLKSRYIWKFPLILCKVRVPMTTYGTTGSHEMLGQPISIVDLAGE